MAYHSNALPWFIGYRGSNKEGGWGDWALGRIVEKPCVACAKRRDSCLRVVVNDFGNINLGACVWCKARSVGCSTAQRRGRGGASKAKVKDAEEPKDKRKASEVDSEESEEESLAKNVKLNSVSEEEWEEWEGIQDKGDWPKESGEMRETEEVLEEDEGVRVSSTEPQEKTEEEKEKEQKESRKVRRLERKVRRLERSEQMKDLVYLVRELGSKVDWFAEEVRVSNVLRNRVDREYLEEQRRWYYTDSMANAMDSGEDSERYSV
jgi:hypothetical protein